jgi:TatD DNase family protein
MIVDTHCHLTAFHNVPQLDHSIVNVSVDLESSILGIKRFNSTPQVFNAVGIHPWFVNQQSIDELDVIFMLANEHNITILGEIGLDFSARFSDTISIQKLVFEKQLAFACHHGLSVSLHLVKSYNEMYKLLKQYPVKGVIHGFSGSVEEAKKFIALGFKLGVNSVICRDHTPRIDRLLGSISIDDIVLETDYPNVRLPNHSKANLDDIYQVAYRLAEYKCMNLDIVTELTTHNAKESLQLI